LPNSETGIKGEESLYAPHISLNVTHPGIPQVVGVLTTSETGSREAYTRCSTYKRVVGRHIQGGVPTVVHTRVCRRCTNSGVYPGCVGGVQQWCIPGCERGAQRCVPQCVRGVHNGVYLSVSNSGVYPGVSLLP